jgi:hypothetical protein
MRQIIYLFIVLFAYSCSPSRFIRPLERDQHAANLSFGGPLIQYDKMTIPVPFLTAAYGYGIDSSLTAYSSLNITSALFGNFQMELGATKQIIQQSNYFPAISINPQINFIYRDAHAHKFYPQFDANFFWEYGERNNYVYVGVSNWFELARKRTLGEPQKDHWYFIPLAGHSFVRQKWNLNVEAKVIAPNLSNRNIVVDYQTPLRDHGAFGVYIGYTRLF